ncbi:MAG TPA: class I SAM-dependent methyltransferase [Candidatus Saccharimonadales bacterium]|nr:class I SAM-dependent methyltransferase [Candidatus Saccharimonadales bacterium]
MGNSKVSWTDPDKIFKDIIWEDIKQASVFAKGRLLDVGCGTKPYYPLFSKKIAQYIGLDDNNSRADIKGNFFTCKISSSSYDTVLCTQMLEHVEEPKALLIKIHKILKTGGILILTAPLTGSLHEMPRDYYRFTEYALSYLLRETGFSIEYIKGEGNWLSSISFNICFYLEGTLNKYLLRYPKKVFIAVVQYIFFLLSKLPNRFTKPELFPINYIVVAKKK